MKFVVIILFALPTLANVDWNAEFYRCHNVVQEDWAKPIIEQLRVKGNEKILDIGCGDGKLTKKLAMLVPMGEAMGLDLSPNMIKTAVASMGPNFSGKLSFVQGDAANFELGKTFDIITSFTALHWVLDHDDVVKSISNHLNPGGRVYLSFPGNWKHFEQFSNTRAALEAMPKYAELLRSFKSNMFMQSMDDYVSRFYDNGVRLDSIALKFKETPFESDEQFRGWLKGWIFADYQMIPEEMQEQFLDDFVELYLSQPGTRDSQGRCIWAAHFLEIVATKK